MKSRKDSMTSHHTDIHHSIFHENLLPQKVLLPEALSSSQVPRGLLLTQRLSGTILARPRQAKAMQVSERVPVAYRSNVGRMRRSEARVGAAQSSSSTSKDATSPALRSPNYRELRVRGFYFIWIQRMLSTSPAAGKISFVLSARSSSNLAISSP